MRYPALGLSSLVLGSFLCGCDVLWSAYVGTYNAQAGTPLCDPTDPTLVLCLTFDGSVVDASGNHLMAQGGPGPGKDFEGGVVGQAARFDASTPALTLRDSPAWDLGAYTFEAWVRPDKQPTSPAQRFGLLDRETIYGVFLYKDASTGPREVALSCSLNGILLKGLKIPLGRFSHVACTLDGEQLTFFLDGKPEGARTGTPVQSVSTRRDTYLGSHDPDGADKLVGALDELRFFSQSRTAAQIQAAYERGLPVR